ncbi:MAG: hypothetical protein IPK53_19740 [bacterium]|nr:hypothetical protein [bacterium]
MLRENNLDEQWLVQQAERFARYGISVDRLTTLIGQACRFLKPKFLESVFESSDPKELDYCYRLGARFLNDDNLDALENMDGTLASLRQFLDENRVDLVAEGYPTTKGIAPDTFEAIFGNLFFTKLPVAVSHKSRSHGRVSVKYQWDIAEVGPSLQIYPSGASEQTASKRLIDLIARPLGFPTGSQVYFRIPIGGQAINVGTYDTAWPMPFLSNEDEKRIAELRPSLFKLKQEVVKICRAALKLDKPSDVFKDYVALTAEIFTLEHIEFLLTGSRRFITGKHRQGWHQHIQTLLGSVSEGWSAFDIVSQTAKLGIAKS